MTPPLQLSAVVGSRLLDSNREYLGRVEDVIVRLDRGHALPPVTGLVVRIGGRELFVPQDRLASLSADGAQTSTTKLNLGQFERRPGEVLLRCDLLGRSLIDVETARLLNAQDVQLVCDDGTWRVAAIDPSYRARLRRMLPRRLRNYEAGGERLIAWTALEPFVGHVPTSRLRLTPRRLARLHPAQIADLVEAASHDEGREILQAVGQDKELEADVFEELNEEHQLEFLRERSDEQVAAVLSRMEPDDAVDLLLEIDQDRRLPVLNLLPAAAQRKLRKLLGYNPASAGGLMSPDFITVPATVTAAQALAAVRASTLAAEQLQTVYVADADGRLAAVVPVAALVKAREDTSVGALADGPPRCVGVEADVPEIALVMSDYNLHALPVTDNDGQLIGVLTVDDVLEQTLPADWRRRAGVARG